MENGQHIDRPWTPVQIFGTAFIFGAGAAGLISGINFHRLGREKLVWPSILGGLCIFLIEVWAVIHLVPDEIASYIAIPANLVIALGFLLVQLPHFRKWKSDQWVPRAEGERYKPGRTGFLFLAGLGAFAVETAIVAIWIISAGGGMNTDRYDNKLLSIDKELLHNIYVLQLPADITPEDYEEFCRELQTDSPIVYVGGASGFFPDEKESVTVTYQEQETRVRRILAEPDLTEVLSLVILEGRAIDFDDPPGSRIVTLSEMAAKELFGEEDPIGKPLTFLDDPENSFEVIGITDEIFQPTGTGEPASVAIELLDQVPEKLFILVGFASDEPVQAKLYAEAMEHIKNCWSNISSDPEPDCRLLADLYK